MDQETVAAQFRTLRDGGKRPQKSFSGRTAACREWRIPKGEVLENHTPYLRATGLGDRLREAALTRGRYFMFEAWVALKDRGGSPSSWDHPAYKQLHLTLGELNLAPVCLQYGESGLARVLVPLYCPDELDKVRAMELKWDAERWLNFFLTRLYKEQLEDQLALSLKHIGQLTDVA